VDGVVCCGGFAIDVYGEVVGFPCYCSVQNIDVVVGFMGWVKLDVVMDVADVLKYVVWVCCSGVIHDENVIDIPGVEREGSVVN
jgi:hypothetical protein